MEGAESVTDPHEMQNIYNDPAYTSVRDDLHLRLDELREKYGETPEDSFRMRPVE